MREELVLMQSEDLKYIAKILKIFRTEEKRKAGKFCVLAKYKRIQQ